MKLTRAVLAASKKWIENGIVRDIWQRRAEAGITSPTAAMFGGVIGQEVVKACTGKFTPLNQFFYFDSSESLPEKLSEADLKPIGSRYDGQISVLDRPRKRSWRNKTSSWSVPARWVRIHQELL